MKRSHDSGGTIRRFLLSRLAVATAGVVLSVLGAAPTAGASAPSLNSWASQGPAVNLRHGISSNWAGYAAHGSMAGFSSVTATWVQPSVTCGSQNAYSSYWVGLDGYDTSTVEQLGTEADCSGGSATYYAWYEMYPHWGYYIDTVTVTPGDPYTAGVTYQGSGTFILTLRDNRTRASFSTTQKLPSAKRASAEAIVEAPWSGGVLPLADFGTASFSGAKANGSPLGGFSQLDPMTMDNPYGMVAAPSRLRSHNTAFSVTWSASTAS